MTDKNAAAQVEARFKAKAERERDAPVARAEYDAAQKSALTNMERLRALRLARDADDAAKAAAAKAAGPAAPKKRSRKTTSA